MDWQGIDRKYRFGYDIDMVDIKSLNLNQLEEYIKNFGQPSYRAKQLYEWLHVHLAESYDEMTNLPKSLRGKLAESASLVVLRSVRTLTSKQDGTKKYLFALPDGNLVESVLMHYHHGMSVCISSQAGCRMGCAFCASAIGGLARNLTPSEMLEQVYAICRDAGERVSNVVVMGTGEPLDNYDNLIQFLTMLTDENGLHISQRSVTVSTCGLVPEMKRLAGERLSITLALSLHAPNQKKREALMPVAKKFGIEETVDTLTAYGKETGRRVTAEYALIAGENDSDADAKELAKLLAGRGVHVNLIPLNPVKERKFTASEKPKTMRFQKLLEEAGINVTVRREMGRDIDGACGQLRRSVMKS